MGAVEAELAAVVVVGEVSEGTVQAVDEAVLLEAVGVVLGPEADHRHVFCIKTGKFLLTCCIRLTSCTCYELVIECWFSGIHCFLEYIIPNFVF